MTRFAHLLLGIGFTLSAVAACAQNVTAATTAGAAGKGANPTGPSRLQMRCMAADLNHDGQVSLDEFHRDIVASWHNLVPSADGFVSLVQLKNVPGVGKVRLGRLAAADKDGDGRLSFKEVVEKRMAYFDAADTDRNDALSLNECVKHERLLSNSRP